MMTTSAIIYINKCNKLGESLWSVLVGHLFYGALCWEKKWHEDLVTKLHWRMLVEVPLTAVLQDVCSS